MTAPLLGGGPMHCCPCSKAESRQKTMKTQSNGTTKLMTQTVKRLRLRSLSRETSDVGRDEPRNPWTIDDKSREHR